MSELNLDVWDENDYYLKDVVNLGHLAKTHVKLVDSYKFDFVDYKANENMPCLLYFKVR